MKRLIRWLAHLYPAGWRRRYGAEFDALLEDQAADFRTLWNVVAGAVKMQIASWNFAKIVTASALLGALAAFVGSFAIPKVYRSTVVIQMNAPPLRLPAQVVARERLKVMLINGQVFAIQFDDSDPEIAARTLRQVTAALRRYFGSARLLEVLDPPSIRRLPVRPDRLSFAGWGLAAGLLAGVLIAFVRRYNQPRAA
jgi:uncharacterized protein involved in exopolysaccharide biosynthesis